VSIVDPIIVKPDSTFEEFLAAASAGSEASPLTFVMKIATVIFSAVLTIMLIETWGSLVSGAAVALALSAAAIYGASLVYSRTRLRARYECGRLDPATYTFSDANVVGACECTRSEMTWRGFDGLTETKSAYLLSRASGGSLCIPKRDVPNGRLADFTTLLKERIPTPNLG
jgi:hypothetical protein